MTPEEVLARLDAPLSLRRRVGYLTLAFTGLTASALIGLLWATEPGLPTRTNVAFAVLVTIGLCWAVFGGWAVTHPALPAGGAGAVGRPTVALGQCLPAEVVG
ncbi:hypothetical protein ABZ749_13460, partial [Micromonospora sp. NPDC047753]|uniref:hypothetical protein n=1 Tax=Micromonospora sp. NPDC047753 TaxID=3154817 RepID=UPI0033F8A316